MGSPGTISIIFFVDGQGTKCYRNIAENFNRLSRVHERCRQTDRRQTDGRAIAYSEREREFTFAKNVPDFQLISVHCKKSIAEISFSIRKSGHRIESWRQQCCSS